MAIVANRRETMANGNKLELWGFTQAQDSEARRLAAKLPRGMEGLRMVESGCRPTVWLEGPEESSSPRRFSAPDGYEIAEATVFPDGTAAYDLVREGER